MPKITHLKKIHKLTHMSEEETKLYLGMLVLGLLEEKRIELSELDQVEVAMKEGLRAKKK